MPWHYNNRVTAELAGAAEKTIRCVLRALCGCFSMLTVNEIFYSIQGESTRAGEPCV